MKITLRAALAATLLAGISAPLSVAFADASPVSTDTVLVPRTVKGANAGWIRVSRDSSAARRYFATAAMSAETTRAAKLCPGTRCVQTRNCYPVKGALGARCVTK